MDLSLFHVLFAFLTIQLVCGKCQYEHLSKSHTMCVLSAQVGCKASQRGVTNSQVKDIIDYHNEFRSEIAHKKSAANMMKIEWDAELAQIAQRLVDQCKFQRDCTDCRAVDRFEVGQNNRQSRKSSTGELVNSSSEADWKSTIQSWATPKIPLPDSAVRSYVGNKDYYPYSQLIWADTKYVGCGYISQVNSNQEIKIYACNYGPAGNIIGDSVFKTGAACSLCPNDAKTCVTGLCQ